MTKHIYLSYFLNKNTPAYGGGNGFYSGLKKSLAEGDSCNVTFMEFSGHAGTHIDFPRHFFKKGKTLQDFSIEDFIFTSVFVAEIPNLKEGGLITKEHFDFCKIPEDIDFLIIKTGWGSKRNTNNEDYSTKNPGIKAETAIFLRESFKNLKAVGFDFISVSSFLHRKEGRTAHKAFLGTETPILLVEDMCLDNISGNTKFKEVRINPLLINDADGAPVNITGEIYE